MNAGRLVQMDSSQFIPHGNASLTEEKALCDSACVCVCVKWMYGVTQLRRAANERERESTMSGSSNSTLRGLSRGE